MQKLTILQNGIINLDGKPLSGDILNYLGDMVELDEDYILRSYFMTLVTQPCLSRLNPFLPELLNQYESWTKGNDAPFGLDYLELSKVMELIGYPGPPRMEIYTDFHGVLKNETVEIKSYPVETLLGAPLKLGGLKHKLLGDRFEEMEFATVFNLFEFIDAVAWQLAFHGSPIECALRR